MTGCTKAWAFRGVQLDLARQMETIEAIRGFTDFMAGHGFNTLVLYLEGRIRTPSFPYPKDEECYTPEQMREVVRHAATRGIGVVPVIPNLGHVEQFLRHPELAHLAELRDGRPGRLSTARLNVCPSLKETYAFFEAYFTEVAELFPSPYFHVGNDEAFDIGYCDLCRARADGREGQTGIFAQHLRDTHAIVAGKLGKRMIVWDDLFEHYWDALDQIPKDIVLCCWQYGADASLPSAHFKNRRGWDLLGEYRQRGFDTLAAPREMEWRNVVSLTRYAAPRAPLGGLVTVWELSRDFLHASYPNLALAGRLWSEPGRVDDPQPVFDEVSARLFPGETRTTVRAVWDTLGMGRFQAGGAAPAFLKICAPGRRAERTVTNRLLTAAMEGRENNPILEDLLVVLGRERLQLELAELVPRLYETAGQGKPLAALIESLRACVARADALADARYRQWAAYRPGILSTNDALHRYWTTLRQSLTDLADAAAAGALTANGLLTVEYFLPDAFSCQWVSLFVQHAGESAWAAVAERDMPKPLFFGGEDEREHSGYLRALYPVQGARPIAQCRIESWGYGGLGIRHLEYRGPSGMLTPCAVRSAVGRIAQPHHALDNSSSWCWLGEADTGLAFHHPDMARARHELTLLFGPPAV